MNKPIQSEFFIRKLYTQLRRRDFPLSPMDYEALRNALRAGFGWSSRDAIRQLCCSLWAKSLHEQKIVESLFDQLEAPAWYLDVTHAEQSRENIPEAEIQGSNLLSNEVQDDTQVIFANSQESLPSISIKLGNLSTRHFLFEPQFPVTYRQTVQAWRRLRRPSRFGAATDIDLEATIIKRIHYNAVTIPVLIPPRRNTARLLILLDRKGSMTPYHAFCDDVVNAILASGRMDYSLILYCHDLPEGLDDAAILPLYTLKGVRPRIDSIISQISPLQRGFLFKDQDFYYPFSINSLNAITYKNPGCGIVIVSDGGAARGHYDTERLARTVAFIKLLRLHGSRCVWLNPVANKLRWDNTTAAEIARYIPMFPLSQNGMNQAVNVLRGQDVSLDRAI